ncbi:putative carboxyl-terminal protease protein [Salinisphaera shabanensis E1L3A]|uniref:Carboxyl-terminal protease protein n=1 Tax=Salinisphaera shabanensis E1L3A TaxID=1033802 RepID=U2FWH6_9GAMM|nr:hypothetical protein [Salinisphaera shabanensis]ERJ18588.1 putative carboxyl-terminal protease protein [Salinisphaera shabanensis E1L3A]
MRSKTRSSLLIALGVVIGVIVSVAQGGLADRGSANTDDSVEAHGLPLDELRTFVEILNRVKQGYVEDVSDRRYSRIPSAACSTAWTRIRPI